jgi:hypothetical protein
MSKTKATAKNVNAVESWKNGIEKGSECDAIKFTLKNGAIDGKNTIARNSMPRFIK